MLSSHDIAHENRPCGLDKQDLNRLEHREQQTHDWLAQRWIIQRWINIYESENVAYWAGRLKVSEKLVMRAVRTVGGRPTDVRKWLATLAA